MELIFKPNSINWKFEISVLSFFTAILIIFEIPNMIRPIFLDGADFPFVQLLNISLLPVSFLIINLIIFFILRRQLLLRGIIMVLSGIIIASIKFYEAPGIINPVYFFIITSVSAFTIFIYRGDYLFEQLDSINNYTKTSDQQIGFLRDDFKFLLTKTLQGLLALGASLGVSMTILFKDNFDDPRIKFMAVKMLIGFMGIGAGVGYWVIIPLLNGLFRIHEKLDEIGG